MSIPKLTENLNIHQSLPDQPTLTAEELKQEWDKAPNLIKDYINNLLIEGIEKEITNMTSTMETLTKSLYNQVFPIGRGFIDFTNTDYSKYLGFTWVKECLGMFPVGCKSGDADFDTVGKTGGAKTRTANINVPLPIHSHSIKTRQVAVGDVVSGGKFDGMPVAQASGDSVAAGPVPFRDGGGTTYIADETTRYTNDAGNGSTTSVSINTIPPYKVVNYWKRIA